MLPTSNLTDAASKVAGVEPDFKLIHRTGTVMIHSTVMFDACNTYSHPMTKTFSYEIRENDLPIDLFIQTLYCHIDKCNLGSVTWYEFALLVAEMTKVGMVFQIEGMVSSFLCTMIDSHSWFKGMGKFNKNALRDRFVYTYRDFNDQTQFSSESLYDWAKNTEFLSWKVVAKRICQKYRSKWLKYAKQFPESNTNQYLKEWYIYSKVKIPKKIILDLPVEAIRKIMDECPQFWTLILMGISDHQFDLYATTYYGSADKRKGLDATIFFECERVRNGYIGAKEVELLKRGIGEADGEDYSYTKYWGAVLFAHCWKKSSDEYDNNHLAFIEHMTGMRIGSYLRAMCQ